jgi:hypothetical protein
MGCCNVCQEETKTCCSNCQLVYYCCKEHQKSDWKEKHKFTCCKLLHSDLTHVIYAKDIVKVKASFYSSAIENHCQVKTTVAVKKNEIIVLEHILKGDSRLMQNAIGMNEFLFNSLHPRGTAKWKEENISETQILSEEKTISNVFGNATCMAFGLGISAFNHSCKANAYVIETTFSDNEGKSMNVMAVIAAIDIAANSELFITYGEKTGHENEENEETARGFKCNCNISFENRKKHVNDLRKTAINLQNNEFVLEELHKYVDLTAYRRVRCNQIAASAGLYECNKTLNMCSTRFRNKISQQYPGMDFEEAKNKWIKENCS